MDPQDKPTAGMIERQIKDHGYSIGLKVKENGQAVVTLETTYGQKNTISADSGDQRGPERYEVALTIAAVRMLDYEYRTKKAEDRPALGFRL